jgi:hypothetical protein
VRACLRCGSADLRVPGIRDGVLVGTGQDFGQWSCNRCGFTGTPLLFDDEEARVAYETEQAAHRKEAWPTTGWPNLRRPGVDAKQEQD